MTTEARPREQLVRRVGPPHAMRVAMLFCVGIFILLGAGLIIAGIVNVVANPAGGIVLVAAGGLVLALAEMERRGACPVPAPLTMLVGTDDIGFERGGEIVDRVRRTEVGAVVLEEQGRFGIMGVTVHGPDGGIVGRWDTGWLNKGSIGPYRALRQQRWPRAIEGARGLRRISRNAPRWLKSKRGRHR